MKKILLLASTFVAGMALNAQAQYPLVSIAQLQNPVGMQADTCAEGFDPQYTGDTVRIQGVVMVKGGLAQVVNGREVWVRDIAGGGPFSTIDVYFPNSPASPSQPVDILNLVAGDTVEFTGTLAEYQGETEFIPLKTGVNLIGPKDALGEPAPRLLTIGDLNDANRINKLSKGEQWEGEFVEFQNVTVTAVTPFSNGTRVSFDVVDANGNKINVSDRFAAARLSNGFVAPVVGDVYTSLKGLILHSKNGCSGTSGRGYELDPFDLAHYQKGAAAPSIGSITRNPITPTSTQTVTVQATVTDEGSVSAVKLFYAVGASTTTYTSVDMSNGGTGSVYSATIPAQAEGAFVKYYIRAIDNDNNSNNVPNVPTGNPMFYIVRDAGLTIRDVQYTPYQDGNSGYVGIDVTVTGVVTASVETSNLGYAFVQQEGAQSWAGIWVSGSAMANKVVGDKVTVTGVVQENFGITRIASTTADKIGTSTVEPLTLSPNVFTAYSFADNEQYEGMLVKIANPVAGKGLFVVDTNADAPSNFGEYRVGLDKYDPATGMRVLVGRQTSSTYSSLAVSYVNNLKWATTDGTMNVTPTVVSVGDSVMSITGIAYYGFSNMKLLPRNNADFEGYTVTSAKKSLAKSDFVSLYPVPAANVLNVSLTKSGAYTLSISDLAGRQVMSQVVEGNTQVNTSAINSGLYFVTMTDAKGQKYSAGRLAIVK